MNSKKIKQTSYKKEKKMTEENKTEENRGKSVSVRSLDYKVVDKKKDEVLAEKKEVKPRRPKSGKSL